MSEKSIYTTTEKIDLIFDYITKEKKRNRIKAIIKWIFRLFIVAYIFYVYIYLWPIAKDLYTKFFPTQLINQTESSWTWDIQIWNLKINSEKAAQLRALFCK